MPKKYNQVIVFFALLLIVLGIFLVSNNYILEKVDQSFNNMNLRILALNSSNEIVDETIITEEIISDDSVHQEEKKKTNYSYIGKLTIPKINLEEGLVDKNSKYNSVNYGIQTLKESTYPNVSKSNLILVSHSGSSHISKFKHLYKLSVGDNAYIEYQGKKYQFEIKKIYEKPKIGMVTIERNYDKTTLTLITCTHNNSKAQTIYILELV